MAHFENITLYLETATCLKDKVDKMDAIIAALEDAALRGAEGQEFDEYWLDTGQSKIKSIFRDPTQIFKAIISYEKMRQIYLNRLNGRVVRLVDYNSNTLKRRF